MSIQLVFFIVFVTSVGAQVAPDGTENLDVVQMSVETAKKERARTPQRTGECNDADVLSKLKPMCWEDTSMHTSNNIWMYWDGPPTPFTELALKSWQTVNKNWTVRLLNKSSAEEYLPWESILAHATLEMMLCHQADLLRVFLLAKYGGVWTDISSFSWKPLDAVFPAVGYLLPSNNQRDRRISNWFMMANPRDETMMTLLVYLTDYVFRPRTRSLKFLNGSNGLDLDAFATRINSADLIGYSTTDDRFLDAVEAKSVFPYFYFHYLFNAVLRKNPHLEKNWVDAVRPACASAQRDKMNFCSTGAVRPASAAAQRAWGMGEECLMTKFSRHDADWMELYDQRRLLRIDEWMEPLTVDVREPLGL